MSEAIQKYLVPPVEWLGSWFLRSVESLGGFALYCRDVLRWIFRRPVRTSLIFQQLEFIGNQSLNILLLSALAVGAVFGLQIGGVFRVLQIESMMGAVTAKALCMELAPMITSVLLTGRAGSSMTAEISTMKVNEQVDAMEAMAVDPISYLVVPRFLASVLIAPLLCGVFIFVGIIGAYLMGVSIFGVDEGLFVEKIKLLVESRDIHRGLSKSLAFAMLMALLACRYGLRASGGAKGVGLATTNSVVVTLLSILALDVVITYFQILW